MRPCEELLVLGVRFPATEDDLQRIHDTVAAIGDDPGEWAEFARLAALNKVEPMVARRLRAAGAWAPIPAAVREPLERVESEIAARNAARLAAADPVLKRFQEEGIEVCLLKGALFGEWLYGDAGYKRMNDVDMLVRPHALPRIVEIYRSERFVPFGERVAEREGPVSFRLDRTHHLTPWVSPDLACLLGTQWGLKSPLLGLRIDYDAIWTRSRPLEFRSLRLRRMSVTDTFFHLCVHLGILKTGLRDLMDIFNLHRFTQGTAEPIDFPLLLALTAESGATDLVFHALSLAHACDPHPEFGHAIQALEGRASSSIRGVVRAKLAHPSIKLRTCSGYLSTVEKAISELNASWAAREKLALFLAAWRTLLLPPASEVNRLAFDPFAGRARTLLVNRPRAPIQLMRAIAAEISGKFLAALIVKSCIDLLTTFARPSAWRSARAPTLEARLRDAGLTLADLKRVEEGLF